MSFLDRIRSLFGAKPDVQRPGETNPGNLMGRPYDDSSETNPRAGETAEPDLPLGEDVRPPVERDRD